MQLGLSIHLCGVVLLFFLEVRGADVSGLEHPFNAALSAFFLTKWVVADVGGPEHPPWWRCHTFCLQRVVADGVVTSGDAGGP